MDSYADADSFMYNLNLSKKSKVFLKKSEDRWNNNYKLLFMFIVAQLSDGFEPVN